VFKDFLHTIIIIIIITMMTSFKDRFSVDALVHEHVCFWT